MSVLPRAELVGRTVIELAADLRRGICSSRELVRAYLERIETSEGSGEVNAFITVAAERALEQAGRADEW